ncbi:hypothetical protein IEQ34_008739 [Dendrobium chrysotoxum]|uniref:Uncharacterized protein n=1 Tax=Dendrobium chrysotoxum TaxID=161865 RepID=A0AAV7H0E3_DENCH|nr:hypothetical protein IEQ34_008739 [Dendrobium chrysotoxum]
MCIVGMAHLKKVYHDKLKRGDGGNEDEPDQDPKILSSELSWSLVTVTVPGLLSQRSHIKLVSERGFWRDGRKQVDALKGKMEQIKYGVEKIFSTFKGRFSTMKNRMESRFGGLEEMLKKLIEMQSKTPPAVPIANPNHDLIGIPLAKSKGKEIGWEEFYEEISFHQKPPFRALIRGG